MFVATRACRVAFPPGNLIDLKESKNPAPMALVSQGNFEAASAP
jgi:hypothetical protein